MTEKDYTASAELPPIPSNGQAEALIDGTAAAKTPTATELVIYTEPPYAIEKILGEEFDAHAHPIVKSNTTRAIFVRDQVHKARRPADFPAKVVGHLSEDQFRRLARACVAYTNVQVLSRPLKNEQEVQEALLKSLRVETAEKFEIEVRDTVTLLAGTGEVLIPKPKPNAN